MKFHIATGKGSRGETCLDNGVVVVYAVVVAGCPESPVKFHSEMLPESLVITVWLYLCRSHSRLVFLM